MDLKARVRIEQSDALAFLKGIPDGCVQTCVTSPPYYGLRDYGMAGQIGLEDTPDGYVARLVEVFAEVRRALADDGTLWLNIGDSYAASGRGGGGGSFQNNAMGREITEKNGFRMPPAGFKMKDLIGTPWLLAFALRADGWYLRSDIIWSKPNPMPESVTDRPTKAHEYLFLLSKSARYYYDAAATAERCVYQGGGTMNVGARIKLPAGSVGGQSGLSYDVDRDPLAGRNRRSVWTVTPEPYPGAHFAVMPTKLVEPCILAGSRPGDLVLDPFAGSGTVLAVAVEHGRRAVGCDLNHEYVTLARERLATVTRSMFSDVV